MDNLEILKDRLLCDLKTINIDIKGFELNLRPFSKSYYGRYTPKSKKIFLYVYSNSGLTNMYSYSKLFETLLHEVVHHIQWTDPDYVRVKGVMHNEDFYRIYNKLLTAYKRKRVLKRVFDNSKVRCKAC